MQPKKPNQAASNQVKAALFTILFIILSILIQL